MPNDNRQVNKHALMRALSDWAIAAESDDTRRYFYYHDDVRVIESGSVSMLVGHKGSGKSAIAKWLDDVNNATRRGRCAKLSFREFYDCPIHKLITNPDDAQEQYKRLWYYIILSYVCRLSCEDPDIDAQQLNYLTSRMRHECKATRRGIGTLLERGWGLTIFGLFGFTWGGKPIAQSSRLTRVEKRREAFLTVTSHVTYNKPYYIIFDELDEEYKSVVSHGRLETKYHDALVGLIKAIAQFEKDFVNRPEEFHPIMMLRTDIHELLTFANKNKFRDSILDIDWGISRIKNLLAFRISRSLDPSIPPGESLPFNDAWDMILDRQSFGRIGISPGQVFSYIQERTFMRPRDFVAFVKYAAKCALQNKSSDGIAFRDLLDAETDYSDYLRQEVSDAIGGLDREFLSVIKAITDVGKAFPTNSELSSAITSRTTEGIRAKFAISYMLDSLYYYNVIGRLHDKQQYRATFSYNGGGKFSSSWPLMVHQGLWRSLGLATANENVLRERLKSK